MQCQQCPPAAGCRFAPHTAPAFPLFLPGSLNPRPHSNRPGIAATGWLAVLYPPPPAHQISCLDPFLCSHCQSLNTRHNLFALISVCTALLAPDNWHRSQCQEGLKRVEKWRRALTASEGQITIFQLETLQPHLSHSPAQNALPKIQAEPDSCESRQQKSNVNGNGSIQVPGAR